MLKAGDKLMKPIPKGARGHAEQQFYEDINTSIAKRDGKVPLSWAAFLPKCVTPSPPSFSALSSYMIAVNCRYFGSTTKRTATGAQQEYIVLSDLTSGLSAPCVLDVKIGVQSWDEDANPEKAAREAGKWPPQSRLGFRFVGMSTQHSSRHAVTKLGTEFGYSLTPSQFIDALVTFAEGGSGIVLTQQEWDIRVAPVYLSMFKQLDALAAAVAQQQAFRIYGSSVLFVYDAAEMSPTVRAALIDFGHAWPIREEGGVDEGMLTGITHLMLFLTAALLRGPSTVNSATKNVAATQ